MNSLVLFLLLGSSLVPAVVIFLLKEKSAKWRNSINLIGIFFKLFLVGYLIDGLLSSKEFYFSYMLTPSISFVLKVDYFSLLFATLSSVLWLFTTLYAIGYLKNSKNQSRFFGFFSLCVTATVGLSISGNLFTFFIFYEFLTLVTFPLILHEQNRESIRAAAIYLAYTIVGGLFFLVGLVMLQGISGDMEFVSGGYLSVDGASPIYLQILFILLLIGVGVKAAIFPLHHWLPTAMAAPAPVSALLHAVAVVKAGAFGIVRIVYDVYGIDFASSLGLLLVVMIVACVTIIYGSIMALRQSELKKRLAYSTVSQVSYIMLGVSIFGHIGTIGGIIHLVHQGIMKITLFFCAGSFAKTYGVQKIDEVDGLGYSMPLLSLAFSIAALGMIGIPPTVGFLSKWYLGLGALDNGLWAVLGVLVASSVLNAMYFLPIIYRMWFLPPLKTVQLIEKPAYLESMALLIVPPLFTAFFTLLFGVFAFSEWSVLEWVHLLVKVEYPK
ncbi:MAG: complex I subunit 5 family protein [Campylobacterales bacterium]